MLLREFAQLLGRQHRGQRIEKRAHRNARLERLAELIARNHAREAASLRVRAREGSIGRNFIALERDNQRTVRRMGTNRFSTPSNARGKKRAISIQA